MPREIDQDVDAIVADALAERGMELDWYMQVMLVRGAEHLEKFPASKAAYLCDNGRVPSPDWKDTQRFIKLGNLGATMRDDSHLLPPMPPGAVSAAAWLDCDGDGKPDLSPRSDPAPPGRARNSSSRTPRR